MRRFKLVFLSFTVFLVSMCCLTSCSSENESASVTTIEKEYPEESVGIPSGSDNTDNFAVQEDPQQVEPKLSESCDMVLCTGKNGNDYYELVANQIDGYPDSTFEFGVIKNNKWLVELSADSPFIEENGWWHGAEYSNTPGQFIYMTAGCFYYNYDGYYEVLYNPETNVSFNVSGIASFTPYRSDLNKVDYSKLINENGEALARLANEDYVFSYLNLVTGESKPIPLELTAINNNQYVGLLSDGVFYAHASSNFTGIDYSGFFDLNGNQIIDFTEYDWLDCGDYMFHDGQYTLKCRNNSGVVYNITFDTSGKIISQVKVES